MRLILERLDIHVESLIFAAESPISITVIGNCMVNYLNHPFTIEEIISSVQRLIVKYEDAQYSFRIEQINEAFAFMTKPAFHDTVTVLLKEKSNKKLTKVALETLSIIAYKQPVSRTFIERIRGVNCDYTLHKLLEKELIVISGRGEGPGKPLLYKTSEKFMDYFGLRSIKDLPTLKEFESNQEEVGEPSPIEIVTPPINEEE